MNEKNNWDWQSETKEIPLFEWGEKYNWVEEPCVSPDGEAIAAIVNSDDSEFRVCMNGKTWDETYEKAWNLRFSPKGNLYALVANDEEWTVTVDSVSWENRFDYVWNLTFNSTGEKVAVTTQTDMSYGIAVNDNPWKNQYDNLTGMVLCDQGRAAAVVQVEPLISGDIEGFKKGAFTVSVDGEEKDSRFLNIWDISFDKQGTHTAAVVRTSLSDYTVLHNSSVWDRTYPCVWKPVFTDGDQSVIAPVREGGFWGLAKNGTPFWKNRYTQLWNLTESPDGSKIAAVVSTRFGEWTVAENDTPWGISAGDMISDLLYSDDSSKLIALVKNRDFWTVSVNGQSWENQVDKIWSPSVSHSGDLIAVRAETGGRYVVLVNDRMVPGDFDMAFQPEVSPDGEKVLIKVIRDGVYRRIVVPVSDLI